MQRPRGIQRIADIAIDEKGTVTGTGRFVLSGQEALYWRQLALVEDAGELAKDFTDYVGASLPDGTKGELDGFDGLTDYEGPILLPGSSFPARWVRLRKSA